MKTAGGLGVKKNAHIGGNFGVAGTAAITGATSVEGAITQSLTTDSTSSTTGSLITAGGLGVALNAWIGANANVGGTLTAVTITESSDRRFKKNIATLPNALATVQKLRGVQYNWKHAAGEPHPSGKKFASGLQTGFIAQEVEQVVSTAVRTDENGWKSVAYTQLTPFVVEAVKEQQSEIDVLQGQLAEQKVQLAEQKVQLAEQKAHQTKSDQRMADLQKQLYLLHQLHVQTTLPHHDDPTPSLRRKSRRV
jgi:hypothetical protein